MGFLGLVLEEHGRLYSSFASTVRS